jgi:hypothetical protein
VVPSGGAPVVSAAGNQLAPTLACQPPTCLLVYFDGASSTRTALAALLHADGTVTSAGTVLSPAGINATPPVVSTHPAGYLAGWLTASGTALEAVRVGLDAQPVDATPVTLLTSVSNAHPQTAAFAHDGAALRVVYLGTAAGSPDLSLRSFDEALSPLAPETPLTTGINDRAPVLATDGQGRTLIGYHRYDDDPALQTARVKARVYRELPDGGTSADGGIDDTDGQPLGLLVGCACSAGEGLGVLGLAIGLFALALLSKRRRAAGPSSG